MQRQIEAQIATTFRACDWCSRPIRKDHALLVLPRGSGEVCGACVRLGFALLLAAEEGTLGPRVPIVQQAT